VRFFWIPTPSSGCLPACPRAPRQWTPIQAVRDEDNVLISPLLSLRFYFAARPDGQPPARFCMQR
jgi:hypothetical protein